MKKLVLALATLISIAGLVVGLVNKGYASPGPNEFASVNSSGTQANGASSSGALSKDGRYAVFNSIATNLVSGDTNTKRDIFLRDRTNGTTVRVSVDSSGTQGNGDSFDQRISANGRYVVFSSNATNLVSSPPANYLNGVYLHDMTTGTTELIAYGVNTGGTSSVGGPDVSDDGRFVVYIVSPSTSNSDIYVKDRTLGTTTQINTSASGTAANNGSYSTAPRMSGDGRFIVFHSNATNLVSGDTNGQYDVFLVDWLGGKVIKNITLGGDGFSGAPAVSADGNSVIYTSYATNLVSGDTNSQQDVFAYDATANSTQRISISSSGTQGNNESGGQDISDDGRYTIFSSLASNLVSGDTNASFDIFVHDLSTGTTELVSQNSGTIGNGQSQNPAISNDGKYAMYMSSSNNLVSGDTNSTYDAIVSPTGY